MSRSQPACECHVEGYGHHEQTFRITIKENSSVENSNVDPGRSPSAVTIFKVPNALKKWSKNGEAYVPEIVSLGPYHHGRAELLQIESHKKRAPGKMKMRFINSERNPASANADFLALAMEKIQNKEKEIRDSYETKIDVDGKTLARMLSLDGCFILEILRILVGKDPTPEANEYYEPIFAQIKIDQTGLDILTDILKLENQVPLIVLRELLELELGSTDDVEKKLFEVLVSGLWGKFYPFSGEKVDMNQWFRLKPNQGAQEVHHILDLLRTLIVSPILPNEECAENQSPLSYHCAGYQSIPQDGEECNQDEENGEEYNQDEHNGEACNQDEENREEWNTHRAVDLSNAGIEFKGCKGIKEINFKDSTIFLPRITIDESTEALFRNLIAFEMCKSFDSNYVTGYVILMDQLIDTAEDVALLRKKRIVVNNLGSDGEVAQLFNGLCKGVTADYTFSSLAKDLSEYQNQRCNIWRAELNKDYISSPWKIIGLSVATVLLVLTLLQTIFTILEYK